jgi:uncharacterized protein with von Willebrand factor type A (vWA) domain
MGQLRFAGPPRQSFRMTAVAARPPPDLRATLRSSLRTSASRSVASGASPATDARMVLLLDVSGRWSRTRERCCASSTPRSPGAARRGVRARHR